MSFPVPKVSRLVLLDTWAKTRKQWAWKRERFPWLDEYISKTPISEEEFWFDYIADSGDGQMAVYGVACMCLSDLWLTGAGVGSDATLAPANPLAPTKQFEVTARLGSYLTTSPPDADLRPPNGAAFTLVRSDNFKEDIKKQLRSIQRSIYRSMVLTELISTRAITMITN